MKTTLNTRNGFVLALLVTGMTVFAPRTMAVDGKTYAVNVRSSFGSKFTDCFRFDTAGNLVIDLLFQTLTFAHDVLGTHPTRWQSTSRFGDGLAIAFHGRTDASQVKITGDAINEFGDTFVFKGVKNRDCAVIDGLRSGNPYVGE